MQLLKRSGPLLVVALSMSLLSGCKASARTRPLDVGAANEGPGSIAAVRKQLQGTWTLVSLETYPGSDKAALLPATGTLTYDGYGNLDMHGRLQDGSPTSGGPNASNYLTLSGKAVIDPATHRLWVVDTDAQSTAALPAPVAADKVRYFEFAGDTLVTSVEDSNGTVSAKVTWKKVR